MRAETSTTDNNGAVGQLRGLLPAGLGPAIREIAQQRVLTELPRLFREGFGPVARLFIQARNAAVIARCLRNGSRLNFISSFPRSGNTWMRYLLTDVLLQNNGIATATDLPIHPDKVVPDFYCHLIGRPDGRIKTPAVFVKTHDEFEPLERKFSGISSSPNGAGPLSRNCKHLYLFRAPEDSLVSLYHYFDRHRYFKSKSASGPDAFCQTRLAAWESNLSSYLRAVERGVPILFVKYETLLKEPAPVLTEILRWLDIGHDSPTVWRAVLNMHFSKLRALEIRQRLSDEGLSFRRGSSGGGQAELQPATVQAIHQRTAELMERADRQALKPQLSGGNAVAPKEVAPLHAPTAVEHDPKEAAVAPRFQEA